MSSLFGVPDTKCQSPLKDPPLPQSPSKPLPGSAEAEPRFFLTSAHPPRLGSGCVACLGFGNSFPTTLSNPFSTPLLAQNHLQITSANLSDWHRKAFTLNHYLPCPSCIKMPLPSASTLKRCLSCLKLTCSLTPMLGLSPGSSLFLECSTPFSACQNSTHPSWPNSNVSLTQTFLLGGCQNPSKPT